MPPQPTDLRLQQLQLRTRHAVEHLLAGEYLSVFKGRGMDFDEIRSYHPGDEVRSIDWNVTARTGRPHVKRYIEERELVVWLVVDVSASCRMQAPGRTKLDVMHEAAALVAFSAIRNHDRVGLVLWSDHVEQVLPPRKGRRHALRLLSDLLNAVPQSRCSDPLPALDAILHMAQRRVLVLLLSDFLFELEREHLAAVAFRHDLVGIAINHPGEIQPPSCGLAAICDSETGEMLTVDFGSVGSEACTQAFDAHRFQLRSEFAAVRAELLELNTRSDCPDELAHFFRQRLRRTADETGG